MFNTYSTSISYWLFICVDGRLTSPPSCCSISGKIVHIETQKIGNQLSLFQQVSLKPTSSIFCWSSLSLSLSQVKDPCETSSPSSTLHRVFPFFCLTRIFLRFCWVFPFFLFNHDEFLHCCWLNHHLPFSHPATGRGLTTSTMPTVHWAVATCGTFGGIVGFVGFRTCLYGGFLSHGGTPIVIIHLLGDILSHNILRYDTICFLL
jgi:hypothetical protein